MESASFEQRGSSIVTLDLRRRGMRHAVDFDNQLSVECDEVDDVPIDRMLAAELPAPAFGCAKPARVLLQRSFAIREAILLSS